MLRLSAILYLGLSERSDHLFGMTCIGQDRLRDDEFVEVLMQVRARWLVSRCDRWTRWSIR